MGANQGRGLTSVKKGVFRHPAVVAASAAALVALLGLNALAFAGGFETPWLLGGVVIADVLAVGASTSRAAARCWSPSTAPRPPRRSSR